MPKPALPSLRLSQLSPWLPVWEEPGKEPSRRREQKCKGPGAERSSCSGGIERRPGHSQPSRRKPGGPPPNTTSPSADLLLGSPWAGPDSKPQTREHRSVNHLSQPHGSQQGRRGRGHGGPRERGIPGPQPRPGSAFQSASGGGPGGCGQRGDKI